jgi:hypothetical protein
MNETPATPEELAEKERKRAIIAAAMERARAKAGDTVVAEIAGVGVLECSLQAESEA